MSCRRKAEGTHRDRNLNHCGLSASATAAPAAVFHCLARNHHAVQSATQVLVQYISFSPSLPTVDRTVVSGAMLYRPLILARDYRQLQCFRNFCCDLDSTDVNGSIARRLIFHCNRLCGVRAMHDARCRLDQTNRNVRAEAMSHLATKERATSCANRSLRRRQVRKTEA